MWFGIIAALVFSVTVSLVAYISDRDIKKSIKLFEEYKKKVMSYIESTEELDNSNRSEFEAMFEKLESLICGTSSKMDYEKLKAYYKGKFNIPLEIDV